jgi:hypothetical protein
MVDYTAGQMMSWYHSKILRIQHGSRIYNKRYLTDEGIIKLFTGRVEIEEKIDGKLSNIPFADGKQMMVENISGKNTVHDHVIRYNINDKSIMLDMVYPITPEHLYFESIYGSSISPLVYAILIFDSPKLDMIYNILEVLSKLPSHFGSSEIEGLVIKNYGSQLMGKYINEKFEDKLEMKRT